MMMLGSRRKTAGKYIFGFLIVVLSVCFTRTSAQTPDIDWIKDCISDVQLDMKYDLKSLKSVLDLIVTLVRRWTPKVEAIKQLHVPRMSYSLPDTCRYEHPMEIIRQNGFKVSKVKIYSDNGFILTAWRIRCRKNCKNNNYPVLLQHGILCSGADWLYLEPEFVLPFILADAGYEVWIGNARGTQYSQEHLTLDAKDPTSDYWKHGVNKMGTQDVPATVERMKALTGKDKINYVGYSMGTTMFFIYASENKTHYAQNINRFVGLAPAMYIYHFATQFGLLEPLLSSEVFHNFLRTVGKIAAKGIDGPLKYNSVVTTVSNLTNIFLPYAVPLVKTVLDTGLLSLLFPKPTLIKNTKAYQRAMGAFPENISIRTFRHYVQFFARKVFAKFDHPDPEMNMKEYSQAVPPRYDVGNVKVPSLFIGGQHDSLVVSQDANFTATQIRKCPDGPGKCAKVVYNTVPCFTHLDFIWGPNNATRHFVYNQIVRWFDDTWADSYWPELSQNETELGPDYCWKNYHSG